MRRVFNPAFSDRSLREQEPLFHKYVDLLVSKLRDTNGQPVPLGQMLNFATFDIMGDLTFGQPLGLLQSAEYSSWVKNVFDAVRVLPLIQFIEYYPLLSKIYKYLEPRSLYKMKTTHFKHSADRVDKRLEKKSGELRSEPFPKGRTKYSHNVSVKISQTFGTLSWRRRMGRISL